LDQPSSRIGGLVGVALRRILHGGDVVQASGAVVHSVSRLGRAALRVFERQAEVIGRKLHAVWHPLRHELIVRGE
jgi:hypothetical protein